MIFVKDNTVFGLLGVEPYEPFEISGKTPGSIEYRITAELDVEKRDYGVDWEESALPLKFFLLGKYGSGEPLEIIKRGKRRMTLREVEEELGYRVELISS